jgi:thiol-disulfide isomerase/thioredoxin
MNKWVRAAAFAACGLLALGAGWWLSQKQAAPTGTDIRPLMAASIPDLQGKARNLKEWQGRVLVVNFWATWCPPCLREIPEFNRLQGELGGKGLQFVGIAADQAEKVRAFVAKQPIDYPVLLADMSIIEIARLAGNEVGGLPFTVILDREGRWVTAHSGELSREKLLEILQPLL